ncbi:MAG: 50S ribosomal protein L3 [bacterium]|nr:50S ribosomal protein L3 [bacterium]
MKFILGKKKEMTQIFDEKGAVYAGTVVVVSPLTVTQVKTKEIDGYEAVQFGGFVAKKAQGKAMGGHLKDLESLSKIIEVRLEAPSEMKRGDKVEIGVFAEGDIVEVSGISKGKGFQGVVKRHGFHGGPRSHGNAHAEHSPGSISGGLRTHVPKGMRMAGRMGTDRITIKNLSILKIFPETNEMIISGALPGRRGTLLEIRSKN